MKDFSEFVNYYQLDCQHHAIELASELGTLIKDFTDGFDTDMPAEWLELISKIAIGVSQKNTMLMLRCYHEWISDEDAQ